MSVALWHDWSTSCSKFVRVTTLDDGVFMLSHLYRAIQQEKSDMQVKYEDEATSQGRCGLLYFMGAPN